MGSRSHYSPLHSERPLPARYARLYNSTAISSLRPPTSRHDNQGNHAPALARLVRPALHAQLPANAPSVLRARRLARSLRAQIRQRRRPRSRRLNPSRQIHRRELHALRPSENHARTHRPRGTALERGLPRRREDLGWRARPPAARQRQRRHGRDGHPGAQAAHRGARRRHARRLALRRLPRRRHLHLLQPGRAEPGGAADRAVGPRAAATHARGPALAQQRHAADDPRARLLETDIRPGAPRHRRD